MIIVTYQSAAVLPDLLTSVQPYLAPGSLFEMDVVAVDNASTDDSVQLLHDSVIPIEIIQSPTNDGYAAGINRAIERRPDSDAYLVLNPDIRLHPGSLEALVTALGRPGVGIAVPRMVNADGAPRYSLRRFPSVARAWAELVLSAERASRLGRLGERVGQHEAYRHSHVVDWASGSAMLISADCYRIVGDWDERFFLYSEETDYCQRARKSGWRTYYCAEATITHLGGMSRVSPELHALLTLNRVRYFRKHHGLLRSGLFAVPMFLKQSVRALRGHQSGRAAVRSLLWNSHRHPELRRILQVQSEPRA